MEALTLKNRKIGVLGAGTWGMALARMLSNSGNDVMVWSAVEREIDEYSATRVHPNLPKMRIPDAIVFTKDIAAVCAAKDVLLFAVPSVFVRSTAAHAAPYIPDGQVIVDVAKGIEPDTLKTMTEIIADELQKDGSHRNVKLVALSGPTHAEEVAIDLPTTIVSASPDLAAAELVQDVFMNTCMRVYTNPDIKGVELCGALKNIMALGAGISVGLGYGDNARAALITRGMAEITRLGKAMGCMEQTFSGLAGIGDLIVTATSVHSRNNKAGYLIGQGHTPEQAVKEVGMVVEGINALPAAMELAERYQVEMPIVVAVNSVIKQGADPADAVRALMQRDRKTELPQP
jgi:glycerol-3-phosphate dehydrogenase (NAD(P)+)